MGYFFCKMFSSVFTWVVVITFYPVFDFFSIQMAIRLCHGYNFSYAITTKTG